MNAPDIELAMFKVHAQTSRLNGSSLPFKVAAGNVRPKEPQFASRAPTCLPNAWKLILWTPQLSLDRLECMPAAQFEVISVDNQEALPTPLPLLTALHASGDRSRPPRPAVRLSTQSYGTARQSRRQSYGDPPHGPLPGPGTGAGEYQDMALLPVSEPSCADAGHFYPTVPGAHSFARMLSATKELCHSVLPNNTRAVRLFM